MIRKKWIELIFKESFFVPVTDGRHTEGIVGVLERTIFLHNWGNVTKGTIQVQFN